MVRADIEKQTLSVLNEVVQGWELDDLDNIALSTGLMGDLEFESIDVVQFAVALEQAFGAEGLPFENLFMKDGDYVDEITVDDVVRFLEPNLQ